MYIMDAEQEVMMQLDPSPVTAYGRYTLAEIESLPLDETVFKKEDILSFFSIASRL